MKHLERLKELLILSARQIEMFGHHQFDMWDGEACCIMGAPRMVDKESGYSHIVRDVLAHIGYDERWNDQPGRTAEEVVDALTESQGYMTPEILSEVYGDKWEKVLNIIVDIDTWQVNDFRRIEKKQEYPQYENHTGGEYTAALASFLSTVMVHPLVKSDSVPYHGYFDKFWFRLYPPERG